MNLKELLTRKIGPLPAAAWLGIFTVGVLLYHHFRPAGAAVPAAAASTDLGSGSSAFGATAGGGGAGALTPADGALPPPASELGSGGTPVIYDPLTDSYSDPGPTPDGYVQPSYVGPDGQLVSPTTYAGVGVTPGPITPDLVGPPTTYFGRTKPVTSADLPKLRATKPPAAATKPARPASSSGRQRPRKAAATAVTRHAPVRVAPAPVVVHRAPPMAAPTKRKAVLRTSPQQAHNHGETVPARARTAPAPAPKRKTQIVNAPAHAVPAPVRAAAPVPPPVLQPGAIPQSGKVYAV